MGQKKKPIATQKTTKTKKKQPPTAEVQLQQRQEELELINKKLAQSQVELEAAYRQYSDLYDFAPIGYFILARNGAIHQVNLAGANLLGVNHDEVTWLRLAAFVSSESLAAFNVFFGKLLSGEGKKTCELAFEKKGDGLFWARLEAACFEGGDVCRAMLTDITKRKQMASLLQARVRISEFAEWHTLDELFQKTLDEAEALTGSQIGFAHFLEADQKTLQLQMWSTNTLKNMCTAEGKGSHYPVDQAGVWADCVATRLPLVHNDYPNLPASHRKGLPEGYAPIQREIVVPVLRNDLIVMIVGVGNKPVDYDDKDVEVISQLANMAWDIVQRKQVEELLKESEKKLRTLFETMSEGIVYEDHDGKIISANPAAERLLGLSFDQMQGRTSVDLRWKAIYEDGSPFPGETHSLNVAAKTGKPATGEVMGIYNPKLDSYVWLSVNSTPEFLPGEKKPFRAYAVFRDITERKQAEASLRESEKLYRNMNENSPLGMHFYKLNNNNQLIFVGANPAADKLLGVDNSQFTGKTIEEAFPPLIQTEVPTRYRDAAAKGIPWSTEQITYKDTQVVGVFEVRAFQTTPENMVAVFSDITERKRAENLLRESEERFYKAFHSGPVGLAITHASDGVYVDTNEAFSELVGFSRTEIIGQTSTNLNITTPEQRGLYMEQMHQDGSIYNREMVLRNKSGELCVVLGSMEVIELNHTTCVLSTAIDITERKQAENALRESQELFSLFMLHSPIYAFIKEVTPTESRVLQASDNYLEMIGISGADMVGISGVDMVGKTMQDLFPSESAAKFTADDWDVVTTGKVLKLDEELNGRHYTTIKFPIVQGDKTLLAGYTIDITERVQAEVELQDMKEVLETANRELHTALTLQEQLAHTDALTGINNRRYLYELAEHEFEIAIRYQQPLSVIMFDLDHFKEVNDTFGHAAGDQILQRVTQVACAELRSADVIGRYGGEEFVIVLPMTNAQQAYPLAERIRVGVAAIRVSTEKGAATVTLSIGIVENHHGSKPGTVEDMIRGADAVMYSAKQAGRNRTEIEGIGN